MDEEFCAAALAIFAGDTEALRSLLAADPGLATRLSSAGHPTLLQLIACQALVGLIGDPHREGVLHHRSGELGDRLLRPAAVDPIASSNVGLDRCPELTASTLCLNDFSRYLPLTW